MIQVYTGDGKGKTTAALGLAMRAAGAGKRVYICQFLKGTRCAEHAALKKIGSITVEQYGARCFLTKAPGAKDIALARRGLRQARKAVTSERYEVVILDEVNVALACGLLELADVRAFINDTPEWIELILTGRSACPEIIDAADLVSEIKEVKHYFRKGVRARKGIEY